MWKRPVIFIALFVCLRDVSRSQPAAYRNEASIVSDNDVYLFCGKDRYYTNGFFLSYRHLFSRGRQGNKAFKKISEIEAGQKMYTAHTANVTHISNVDRPFAAYLYGGGRLIWYYTNETVLQAGVQIGVIGPQALGKNLQTFFHKTFNMYAVRGWQFQVNNEFEVNTSASYLRLLARARSGKADLSLQAYANGGTTFSGAGAGMLLRLGRQNGFLQSVSTHSRLTTDPGDNRRECFFYLQPAINFVAYDATIEGGMFLQNKGPVTYAVIPLVYTQETGVMYASGRWELNFAVIFKSRELKSTAKTDEYGSVRVGYLFR